MACTDLAGFVVPVEKDFEVAEGSSFCHEFQLKKYDGSSIDLTGYALTMVVRRGDSSEDELLLSPSLTVADPTNGTLEILIGATDLSALPYKSYYAIKAVLTGPTADENTHVIIVGSLTKIKTPC
jgi:hypothetical protein